LQFKGDGAECNLNGSNKRTLVFAIASNSAAGTGGEVQSQVM
jgi:hypothetical protein